MMVQGELPAGPRAVLKEMISSDEAMQSFIARGRRVAYVGKMKVNDSVRQYLCDQGLIFQEIIRMKRHEYEITDKGRAAVGKRMEIVG